MRLARPIPPTPTAAMFSKSLGGVNPRPSTCRGTIAAAALPVATPLKNSRRVMAVVSRRSSSVRTFSCALASLMSLSMTLSSASTRIMPRCTSAREIFITTLSSGGVLAAPSLTANLAHWHHFSVIAKRQHIACCHRKSLDCAHEKTPASLRGYRAALPISHGDSRSATQVYFLSHARPKIGSIVSGPRGQDRPSVTWLVFGGRERPSFRRAQSTDRRNCSPAPHPCHSSSG